MANTFKNAYKDITNSAQTVYTCPGSTTAIVLTLRITNVDGSSNDTITADVIDASSGSAKLAHTMTVPADSSVELAGTSKVVLEAGDKIDLTGGASSGDLEAFVSVLEIT
jgi:hypothetical protein|tara:strand:+ start:2126 stop:2455 length:330 start_codon:yes stop_codon:yes gene_type:complete